MSIRLDGRVAVVTGAGAGLGRAHALALAAHGARVVVNDLGRDAEGGASAAAESVAEEIRNLGGEAIADGADVSDAGQAAALIARATDVWGKIDILVNNAGILRDRTFGKMDLADFRKVVDVHLMGSVNCTHAAWEAMRAQGYGRVVFTTSGSGLYGNFGQSNYGAAKMALVGLMNVLAQEGAKYGIRVNCLAPTAATRMTEGVFAPDELAHMQPESITPGLIWLAGDTAPTRWILSAGAGVFSRTVIRESEGLSPNGQPLTPDEIAAGMAADADLTALHDIPDALSQTRRFLSIAKTARI